MKHSLAPLVRLSRIYGRDPDFVLAGGGNTSYKTRDHLAVKASGIPLADISPEGFVILHRTQLRRIWARKYSADSREREAQVLGDQQAARLPGEEAKRPSVETLAHEMIEKTFVVHTHPALVNGLTCGRRGRAAAEKLFGKKILWVPYTDPGHTLASKLQALLARYHQVHGAHPEIIFLENHGLIVSADTAEAVRNITGRLLQKISSRVNHRPDFRPVEFDRDRATRLAPAIRMLCMGENRKSIVVFETDTAVRKLVQNQAAFSPVSFPFTPDHTVYAGPEALFINHHPDREKQYKALELGLAWYREKHGAGPKIIAFQGLGIFAVSGTKKGADTALALFRDEVKIAGYARSFGGPRSMTAAQIRFIHHWEAENYRRKVSLSGGGESPVSGKVAVVTGSAQGFGLGLAEALLREGANVVLADINLAQANEQAARLAGQYGPGRALALAVDVTNEDSVARLLQETVLHYGGVDVFVSNAGVLKAGSLEGLSARDFDFVTRVNYTGFFLCAKHASRCMKLQHRFRPGYFMDIIQINSKSGLCGSKNNYAYAGGKFGGIGLTQSFALELADQNIKVNAICPGNLFDGPLWSNPRDGLFYQYLRTGKVPGARNIADVRRFYEAKVPMKRGCAVGDVAKALFYIVSQEYETGQAVPVTGGQNMLK
jgi:NAD(P)-dependent dehydrogenase (short-subunit alcohol dehydrogenase family)/rhamnose utilization protein RhaD (predicted bifunctional aldolase and dehydrogenase)